ncbi:MAG: hypothetical protein LUC50_04210 [Ruminococcus sp.]|nr:hypothetical protein [Ruminococcus sp.]
MNQWISGLTAGILAAAALPMPVSTVSGNVIGYGQGMAVDTENRPIDVLSFDAQYADFDAHVTTPDRSWIFLTFDQGYENGYTA